MTSRFLSIRCMTAATPIATSMPRIYMENAARKAYSAKNISAKSMYMVRRALQLMNGVTSITLNLSRLFSSAREAIIAGTVQPKPSSMGMNALPESPSLLIIPSMTYATLAMYPLSSRKASARKSMHMLGKKVMIVPTPLIMPSTSSEVITGLAFADSSPPETAPVSASMPISKSDFIRSPTKKVRKKTTAMMPRNIGIPHILWVNALSSLSVSLSCRCLCTITSSIISPMKSYFSLIISAS